tara:strand:- start:17742 stop:18854 length:1113 start_codon:yes stop_codon:yes gene_type:complete
LTQKKIVFFLFDLGLGGTEQVIVKLSNFLITQGQDVHILCVGDKDDFLNKLNNKVTISNFGKKRIYESFLPLIKFIRNEEFDSFVSNVWPLTFISVVSGFFSKGFLEKLILIEHCHLKEEFKKRGSLFKIFQKISIRIFHNFSRKVVCVSSGVQDDLISKGVKKKKTKVIYNPAYPSQEDMEENSNQENEEWLRGGKIKLIAVGNLKTQKNYPNLISAVELLKKELNLESHLLVLGEGPERDKLENMIHEKGLEKNISLMGLHPNPLGLVKKADVFVLPSNYEGFGLVIVEALSVGVTVVSTDCLSGPSEIIKENEFGYLCKVDDPNDLAKKINFAFNNKIDPEKLKNRSKDFSIETIGPIYKELLDFPS